MKEACEYILGDKQRYIDSINEDEQMFPLNWFSHFY